MCRLFFFMFIAFATCAASAGEEDALAKYRLAKQAYFDGLFTTANSYLDEIYENSTIDIKNRFGRELFKVEIRSGLDERCRTAFATGYILITSSARTIVICEEDVATAADYLLAYNFIGASAMQSNFDLIKKLDATTPIAKELNEHVRRQLITLADYYVRKNAEAKLLLFKFEGRYGKSRCLAWEAAYRLINDPSTIESCYRNSLTQSDQVAAAKWAMQLLTFAFAASSEVFGIQGDLAEKDTKFALDIMNRIRSAIIDRFLYYVVAHEFGHATSDPATEAAQSSKERELSADRYAVTAIRQFQARAAALPFLALTLNILWKVAKTPLFGGDRTDSLAEVVFCENQAQLRSQGVSKFQDQWITLMSREVCKSKQTN